MEWNEPFTALLTDVKLLVSQNHVNIVIFVVFKANDTIYPDDIVEKPTKS